MKTRRLAVLTVLAIALLAEAPSAFAQATQVRSPIAFTLSGCPNLAAGLTIQGSGESFMVVNSRTGQDGLIHIEQNTLITGTAKDSDGAEYSFNYHSHASFTIPPTGFPFTLEGNDHFNLVGNGKALNRRSIHNEQSRTDGCRGPMRLSAVGHLVTHAWRQNNTAPVLELGVQFTREAEQDVALVAPMIRNIAGRVFDHSHSDIAKVASPPVIKARFTLVFRSLHERPVCHAERDI